MEAFKHRSTNQDDRSSVHNSKWYQKNEEGKHSEHGGFFLPHKLSGKIPFLELETRK